MQQLSYKHHAFILSILLLFSLIFRLFLFSGFVLGDDPAYASFISQILKGSYPSVESRVIFACRPLVVYPVACSIYVFGWQEWSFLEPGQFSRRGGLLDLWTPAEKLPVRLDFFGDEIETVRKFDPASQRTIENLEAILITPAREYISRSSDAETSIEHRISPDELSEFHIPLLHKQPASLLDYLPQKSLILIDDLSVVESMVAEVEEQAVKLRSESIQEETLPDEFPLPYITWPDLLDNFHSRPFLELGYSTQLEGDEETGERLSSLFSHDERFGGR